MTSLFCHQSTVSVKLHWQSLSDMLWCKIKHIYLHKLSVMPCFAQYGLSRHAMPRSATPSCAVPDFVVLCWAMLSCAIWAVLQSWTHACPHPACELPHLLHHVRVMLVAGAVWVPVLYTHCAHPDQFQHVQPRLMRCKDANVTALCQVHRRRLAQLAVI